MENKAYSLNLAPMGKRLAAWLLDFILTITLAVGFMLLASVLVNYDKQVEKLNEYYDIHNVYRTDEKGNKTFCEANPNDEYDSCNVAWAKFAEDEEAVAQYNRVNEYSIGILSSGLVLSIMSMYFVVPLCLKHGRTIGKKVMGISLISNEEIKVNHRQMFIRALMGNFLVLSMIPVLLFFTAMISGGGFFYSFIALGIEFANIVAVLVSKKKQNFADMIAKTIAVDSASQIIFDTKEELSKFKYQK